MKAAPLLALVAGSASAWVIPGAGWAAERETARCATPSAQFGFKVQKSERLLIREVRRQRARAHELHAHSEGGGLALSGDVSARTGAHRPSPAHLHPHSAPTARHAGLGEGGRLPAG